VSSTKVLNNFSQILPVLSEAKMLVSVRLITVIRKQVELVQKKSTNRVDKMMVIMGNASPRT